MSEYEDMTVAELKAELKEAGLPVSGKKAELIARLNESGGASEEIAEVETEEIEEDTFEEEDEEDRKSVV